MSGAAGIPAVNGGEEVNGPPVDFRTTVGVAFATCPGPAGMVRLEVRREDTPARAQVGE